MAKTRHDKPKIGRPPKDEADKFVTAFNVACTRGMLDLIERYQGQHLRMTQSEAVRQLIEAGFKAKGLTK